MKSVFIIYYKRYALLHPWANKFIAGVVFNIALAREVVEQHS